MFTGRYILIKKTGSLVIVAVIVKNTIWNTILDGVGIFILASTWPQLFPAKRRYQKSALRRSECSFFRGSVYFMWEFVNWQFNVFILSDWILFVSGSNVIIWRESDVWGKWRWKKRNNGQHIQVRSRRVYSLHFTFNLHLILTFPIEIL